MASPQSPNTVAYLLIAAPPADPRAPVMADALRAFGWQVWVADSPEHAAQAAPGAYACIILLTATQWNNPISSAAVLANPLRLVPVLAEPMMVPSGRWTTPPIPINGNPAEVARSIMGALRLQPTSGALTGNAGQPPMSGPLPMGPPSSMAPPQAGPPPMGPSSSMAPPQAGPPPMGPPSSMAPPQAGSPPMGPPNGSADAFLNSPSVGMSPSAPPTSDHYGSAAIAERPPARAVPGMARDGRAASPYARISELSAKIPVLAKSALATRRRSLVAGGAVLVLVILALALIVPSQLANLGRQGNQNTQPYSAAVPGPGCDHGAALWQIPVKAPAIACQNGALVVTQPAGVNTAQEVFFRGVGNTFPANYHVQVEVTVTGGTAPSVGFEVHRQLPTGGDILLVSTAGIWQIASDSQSGASSRLGLGFLAQGATDYTLSADVYGTTIAFAIAGKTVATVADAAFTTTQAIALVLIDPQATGAVSAAFSHFSYAPLTAAGAPNPTPVTGKPNSYTANVPGPGCDTGGGVWEPPALYLGKSTTLHCTPAGLVISQAQDANLLGEARFFWTGAAFPANYQVATMIDLSQLNGGCAGFLTRTNAAQSGYSFAICQNGGWWIARVDAGGQPTLLTSGLVTLTSNLVAMQATLKGPALSLTLNGAAVGSASDATYTATSEIDLIAQTPQAVSGSVTFAGFTFTPQAG